METDDKTERQIGYGSTWAEKRYTEDHRHWQGRLTKEEGGGGGGGGGGNQPVRCSVTFPNTAVDWLCRQIKIFAASSTCFRFVVVLRLFV